MEQILSDFRDKGEPLWLVIGGKHLNIFIKIKFKENNPKFYLKDFVNTEGESGKNPYTTKKVVKKECLKVSL